MNKMSDTLRTKAESLKAKVSHLSRPLTQNPTPKRMKEYNMRSWEASNVERTRRAMLALAELHEAGECPMVLLGLRNFGEIEQLVHQPLSSGGGYYDVIRSNEYRDKSPAGVLLQSIIADYGTPAEKADAAERSAAQKIIDMENRLRFCKIDGFFPTPPSVINTMLAAADVQSGQAILEPSAGKGDIADAIRKRTGESVTCFEVNHSLREILQAKGHPLAGHDFMEYRGQLFDRILMNPPFENGQDIDHVMHAYSMLEHGGILVALMSAGSSFRSDKKSVAFREFIAADDDNRSYEQLGDGTFSGPDVFRQTGVNVVLVVIRKPAAAIPVTLRQQRRLIFG